MESLQFTNKWNKNMDEKKKRIEEINRKSRN